MTHLISSNLPVVFQCLRVEASWDRALQPLTALLYKPDLTKRWDGDFLEVKTLGRKATTFDPWEKRNEFFRLRRGDTEGLLSFLQTVGVFHRPDQAGLTAKYTDSEIGRFQTVDHGKVYYVEYLRRISENEIWEIRRLIEGSLQKAEQRSGEHSDFHSRIVRSEGNARLIVTTTTFLEALELTITVDQVQRAKIRKCARPDCGVSFSNTGGHKKKYCEWNCGHVESVRRSRKRKRKGVLHGK